MTMFKLKPACKNYLWGGDRLARDFNIHSDDKIIAEAWTLSCHPDGLSEIITGKFAGKTLREYLNTEKFPVLIKLLDVHDKVSIQVHPDDKYALEHENQLGKNEFWYIVDAEPDSYIYYGFKREISKDEFIKRVHENNLLEVLNKIHVHKGESYFINSGTLHAAGNGVLLAEIQESSNVTYRIYDYDRVDANGNKRALHLEKALDVLNFKPTDSKKFSKHLADCEYFTVDKINLHGEFSNTVEKNFVNILVLSGAGKIIAGDDELDFIKGDSIFISGGAYKIIGDGELLITAD